jgi:ELWxxDGT repeat protein
MFPSFPVLPPRFLPIAVVIAASAFSLSAQPRLVKDINVTISPVGSDPQPLRTIGDVTFFSAQTAATGKELWTTDATGSGTALVRDIFPGPASGLATDFVSTAIVGNRLIFVANDGVHGWECWASDGTAPGTVQLADIGLTKSMDAIFGPVIGQTLYFTAGTDESTGRELWRTDGTPAGTRRVLDRNSAIGQSGLSMIAPLGSLLLLSGDDGPNGAIYSTDGTPEGTHFIAPYGTSSGVSLGGAVLFVHNPDPIEWKLMRTDGTSPGTTLLRDGFTGIGPFRVMNGVAYFTATDPVHGNGLWRSDGTIAGTSLVADLTPGADPAAEPLQASLRAVLGGRLLFMTPGKLWISDGTAAGTHLVKEIQSVLGGVVSGSQFYFVSQNATHGRELWKTDGTAEGTMLVADIAPGPSGSIVAPYVVARPGGVLFSANDGVAGNEPWITDGTMAGTRLLENIAPEKHVGSDPINLADVDGRLFFRASGGVWMSDGTTEGTSRLETAGNLPDEQPAVASGGLYYFVKGSHPAFELWRTDGTASGTFPLYTMGDVRSRFDDMTPFHGGLLFQGSDPPTGMEPWFTTGTVAGTRLLKDIDPGMNSGYVFTYPTTVVAEGTALFEASGGGDSHGELWRTDGTPAGTRRLTLLPLAEWVRTPGAYTKFGDAFYFVGARWASLSLPPEPLTLWRVDAVSGAVTAIRPIGNSLRTTSIWNLGGTMVFTAGNNELWRSDGTEAGTTRIHDAISLDEECYAREDFVVGDGVLYWYAFAEGVPELWRSDGTAAGTFRLGSFPGPYAESLQDCRRHHLHYSDGRLYFIGRDDLYGAEPWVTNGTLMGTRMLWDVNPGPDSSNPASFLRIGRTLFFSADEPSAGRELWAMETGCDGECPPRRRRIRH